MRRQIRINDDGRPVVLDYESFLAYHGGGALAGAAIGFRAMDCAGSALSRAALWDRQNLSVTTRHDGPGVRDAIEFVTRCVTRGRFRVEERADPDSPCASHRAFQFTVSDGRRQVQIALRSAVLAEEFFDAVARSTQSQGSDQVRDELTALKKAAAATVIAIPVAELFTVQIQALQEHDMREHA